MSGNEIGSYCREIETYLCRKNDGHLIRVVGPSFEIVAKWAAEGVPLKIAFRGIDRYFERYYRKGPRRRPVRIDFCEADVLDAFDEWRRAVGIVASRESGVGSHESLVESRVESRVESAVESRVESGVESGAESGVESLVESGAGSQKQLARERSPEFGVDRSAGRRRGPSLPEHLERVLLKLTSARAGGAIGPEFDGLLDQIGRELDVVRADARGLRGEARQAVLDRLAALDTELVAAARQRLGPGEAVAFDREADSDLRGFRATMTEEAYARARTAAVDRLVRERFNLPIVKYTP